MKVVVGLGNPGREYQRTRHNVGWLALDALAERLSAGRFRSERSVEVAEAMAEGGKVYLLKPQTYMNRSGQALASWLGTFREVREAVREADGERSRAKGKAGEEACLWPGLLVVSDDVNLPLGKLRFRPSGSAGGHNGLKDIEKALGGRGYPRLRLGVGEDERMDRIDYVLGRFSTEEAPWVEKMIATAAVAVTDWMSGGLEAAREKYNGLGPDF